MLKQAMNPVKYVIHQSNGGVIVRLIIDRFEAEYAVCEKEDKKMIKIAKVELPPAAKEGTVLEYLDDKIKINYAATKEREKKIKKLMDDLWE